MRKLLFIAGGLAIALGFTSFHTIGDRDLLQGGITLGGGFIICAIFTMRSKWHGIGGAGVLAFLGALRAFPGLGPLGSGDPAAFFKLAAWLICTVVLVTVVRALRMERLRHSIERMENGGDPRR